MPRYPIEVPIKQYRGRNPRGIEKAARFNEIAARCEEFVNQQISKCDDEIQTIYYASIARQLNLPLEEVRDVMFGVNCGSNGITIRKASGSPTRVEHAVTLTPADSD